MIKDNTNNTKNTKNKILAMDAAPAAIPPNPKMAATMATIRKITVQRNITYSFKMNKYFFVILINNYTSFVLKGFLCR